MTDTVTPDSVPPAGQAEKFASSARRHLASAEDGLNTPYDFVFEETYALQFCALHLGTAVELLSHAVIAHVDASSLYRRGTLFTLEGAKSLRRALELAPSIGPIEGLSGVLQARNAAAHRAEARERAILVARLDEVRTFEARILSVMPDVAQLIVEADEARADAASGHVITAATENAFEKLHTARAAREIRNESLTAAQIETIDAILVSRYGGSYFRDAEGSYSVGCPACTYPGAVVASVEEEFGGVRLLVPIRLRCLRCDLDLDHGEAEAVGVAVSPYFAGER